MKACPDVRVGSFLDRPYILDLMRLAHEEAAEHPLSEAKVCGYIEDAVRRRGSIIGVVGEEGKPLKGYVLMVVAPVWYSNDNQLLELSNFVHPDYRRSDYAKQMIEFAKSCSDSLGIDLSIGVYSNERTEAKVRLYRRQVEPVGAFFRHHPQKAG